jgi:hypothetical protein
MRTKVLLGLAVAVMLIVSVATIGSNMGFKISIPLTAGYNNYVSIPYYNSYTNAGAIFSDVTGATQVKRWDNASGTFQSWNGTRGTNFSVTEGEAYIITVSSTTNWVVVGSHDPSFALTLTAGYNNHVSIPYHTTATNAGTLFSQITGVTQVKRWDNASGTFQSWNGTRGTNFTLSPGEGLIVTVSGTGTWTPAHY